MLVLVVMSSVELTGHGGHAVAPGSPGGGVNTRSGSVQNAIEYLKMEQLQLPIIKMQLDPVK